MNNENLPATRDKLVPSSLSVQKEAPDASLVETARLGDMHAFTLLVERHTERIYALASRLLEDTNEAEDATQEAFIRAYYHLSEFRGEATFASWLYRIALNICRDQLRHRQVQEHHLDLKQVDQLWDDEHYTVDPERVVLALENQLVLKQALQQLPANYRATLLLHDVDGLKVNEIALLMNVPLPTVKSRLRRARMALVTLLDEHENAQTGTASAPVSRRAFQKEGEAL